MGGEGHFGPGNRTELKEAKNAPSATVGNAGEPNFYAMREPIACSTAT